MAWRNATVHNPTPLSPTILLHRTARRAQCIGRRRACFRTAMRSQPLNWDVRACFSHSHSVPGSNKGQLTLCNEELLLVVKLVVCWSATKVARKIQRGRRWPQPAASSVMLAAADQASDDVVASAVRDHRDQGLNRLAAAPTCAGNWSPVPTAGRMQAALPQRGWRRHWPKM